MTITEKIVKEQAVSYEGVFDLQDFIHFFKKHLKDLGYDIIEKLYDTKGKDEVTGVTIKWEAEKKATDYDKFVLGIKISGSDLRSETIDGEKVVEGTVKVSVEGALEKDYDERWKLKPTLNFLRSMYDKYIVEEKQGKLAKKFKEDADTIIQEVKTYFNIK